MASALNKSNTLPCATYKSPYFCGPCTPFKSPCNDRNCRTEAIAGALPLGKNSPQKPPYGLYAEKLSGTAFTAPRHSNQQSWLYRILPSVAHSAYERADSEPNYLSGETLEPIPNQLRWNPFDIDEGVDWVRGLRLISGAGSPALKTGLGILMYQAGVSMGNEAFYSADGDFLIVPQAGDLEIQTELGKIYIKPGEIVVIPRGIRLVQRATITGLATNCLADVRQISGLATNWPCKRLHLRALPGTLPAARAGPYRVKRAS